MTLSIVTTSINKMQWGRKGCVDLTLKFLEKQFF